MSSLSGNETDDGSTGKLHLVLFEFIESRFAAVFFGILWSLLALFGILGNGLVIFIAIFHKKLNDITNCYIFNLAITDLLFIIFCIPFTTYLWIFGNNWTFGEVFCKLNHFMSHASVQSTCLTLTAMTIHRCRLIIKNKIASQNAAKIKERQHTVLLITIFIWIISFVVSSPDLVYYTLIPIAENNSSVICGLPRQSEYKLSEIYIRTSHFISIGTTYVIPLLIIVLSYARLLSHLAKNQKNLAKFNKEKTANGEKKDLLKGEVKKSTGSKSENSKNKRKKVTKMVALVTLNFGICWLPTHLLIIMRSLLPNKFETLIYLTVFKLAAHTLSYLTPVINPCFYAFYNENFRKSLLEIWAQVTCRAASSQAGAAASTAKSKKIIVI